MRVLAAGPVVDGPGWVPGRSLAV